MSLSRVVFGFTVIAAVFVGGAVALEATNARARERDVGARPLELAPRHGGGLRVVATPWAHVSVDGQQVETTPFARPIPLAAGKHWVTLMHPEGAAPIEREIEIVPGEVVTLDVTIPLLPEDGGKDN